jgi:ribose 5-phosphate isomerase B
MKIAIASDHAGFELKEEVRRYMTDLGHEVLDLGAFNTEPSDYPDYAEYVGRALHAKNAERGVLICGSGVGVSRRTRCRASALACATTPTPRTRASSTTI